jgi:hypothetical protein
LLDDEDVFLMVPMHERTESKRVLAFRMLSRSGCYEEEMLCDRHSNYPFKLFDVIDAEAEKLREIEEDMSCPSRVDEFTEYMMKDRFGATSDILRSATLRAELCCVAAGATLDIGTVEHGHASFQRMRLARSHHTHVSDFTECSMRWLIMVENSKAHSRSWVLKK